MKWKEIQYIFGLKDLYIFEHMIGYLFHQM
uniref:Uncharacterized protein n=1 Tax=Arundo donax TaxID=35708 RepID=A0A0A8ZZH8_ARUDO